MMSSSCYQRILLFGDEVGLPRLLKYVPHEYIVGIVTASIRPKPETLWQSLTNEISVKRLLQPPYQSHEYKSFSEQISALQPDLLLCDSYSMMIQTDVLQCVKQNAINIHASLLPRNRGPNPLQWALIQGDQETGVSMHYITDTLDGGDLLAQYKVAIGKEDTWTLLLDKVNQTTEKLWHDNIDLLLQKKLLRRPQTSALATKNKRLTADFPRIDFHSMNDWQIYNLIRAQVSPLAGAYVEMIDGKRIYFKNFIPFDAISEMRKKYMLVI